MAVTPSSHRMAGSAPSEGLRGGKTGWATITEVHCREGGDAHAHASYAQHSAISIPTARLYAAPAVPVRVAACDLDGLRGTGGPVCVGTPAAESHCLAERRAFVQPLLCQRYRTAALAGATPRKWRQLLGRDINSVPRVVHSKPVSRSSAAVREQPGEQGPSYAPGSAAWW